MYIVNTKEIILYIQLTSLTSKDTNNINDTIHYFVTLYDMMLF